MSSRYDAINRFGGRVAGITVDPPPQNSAMIEKLQLPFPILSDPDRSKAIEPYGVADPKDARNIARPSIFVVSPEHEIVFSAVSRDFADRSADDGAIAALEVLDLPPTTPEDIELGPAEAGPKAMPFDAMEPYYRGAKFAVTAMRSRHPAVADDANEYIAQMDRYLDVVRDLRGKG